MPSVISKRVLVAISAVIVVAIVVSAFMLFSMPSHQPTTIPSAPGSSGQTSNPTKLVYTDILSQGIFDESTAVKVNEVFIIHLAANTGSTGYDWNVSTSGGVRYLNYTTTSVGALPGAPSERDYRFQALAPGTATITLVYGRFPPAFSVTQIAKTVRVSVSVTA